MTDKRLTHVEFWRAAERSENEVRRWPAWRRAAVDVGLSICEPGALPVGARKIIRNLSTPEAREWWRTAEEAAAVVATWPDWKRAGINTAEVRETERETQDES